MKLVSEPLPGLLVLQPKVFSDARGHFMECFQARDFQQVSGVQPGFVQTNESLSRRGVLRGLHWQTAPRAQGKLVRVSHGVIYDVAVDLRHSEGTFGQWYGLVLSAENHQQLWIPPGFAHGFLTLSETAVTSYQVTAFHSPECERCLLWNDPVLNIDWPLRELGLSKPIVSEKDAQALPLDRL